MELKACFLGEDTATARVAALVRFCSVDVRMVEQSGGACTDISTPRNGTCVLFAWQRVRVRSWARWGTPASCVTVAWEISYFAALATALPLASCGHCSLHLGLGSGSPLLRWCRCRSLPCADHWRCSQCRTHVQSHVYHTTDWLLEDTLFASLFAHIDQFSLQSSLRQSA